jgi:hypothetical protein
MTAASTAVPEMNAGTRTPRTDRWVRVLSAGVSGVMLAVTVLVCAQVRTDLRRSRLSLEMAQGQLQRVQRELAHARSDRAALLIARTVRPMAVELPMILRQIPPTPPTRHIVATADTWRVLRGVTTDGAVTEDLLFPRATAGAGPDHGRVDE